MSVIHNILTKKSLDISELNDFVSTIDNATFEDRGEGVYYYWIEGKSTRGFDITIDGDTIEIRNTVLSNKPDYDLTNKVVEKILKLTDGIILDEVASGKIAELFRHESGSQERCGKSSCVYRLPLFASSIQYGYMRGGSLTLSSAAISSGVNVQLLALRLSASCSLFFAPIMTLEIAGLRST